MDVVDNGCPGCAGILYRAADRRSTSTTCRDVGFGHRVSHVLSVDPSADLEGDLSRLIESGNHGAFSRPGGRRQECGRGPLDQQEAAAGREPDRGTCHLERKRRAAICGGSLVRQRAYSRASYGRDSRPSPAAEAVALQRSAGGRVFGASASASAVNTATAPRPALPLSSYAPGAFVASTAMVSLRAGR